VKLENANQVQETQECWQSSGKHITWRWEIEQKNKEEECKI
jgi:hypothetical protein